MAHGAHVARQTETGHSDPYRPFKLVAWAAGIVGLLMVVGGTGHLVGVIGAAVHRHKLFNFRLVSLLAIGGMLLYPGLLNLGISRSIWLGRQWAFVMSAFATVALLAYGILLMFMKTPPDPTDPFAGASTTAAALSMIQIIYLAFLLPGWMALRRRHRT
jgi:hypothetical protein